MDIGGVGSGGGPARTNQPIHFGRPYQWHDGSLDITHTSNLVTVSYNVFTNHDKVIGAGVAAADLVHDWGGTVLTEKGTWVRSG